MCGIAGIVSRGERSVEPGWVESMVSALSHRGPDGKGVWCSRDGGAVIGHTRLAIVDLSDAGRQPMVTPDGRFVVSFNGEIYNHLELREALELRGHTFRSATDTEALLYLAAESPNCFVERLDGDFGVAIWDDREQRLVLARDRAGVKPVYYAETSSFIVFASELRAVLASGLVTAELDEEALYHYLTFLATPAPFTLVGGVRKLPPASIATWRRGDSALRMNRYWEPFGKGEPFPTTEESHEQFEDLFRRSVRKRLMADVPTGALFSGGVDSTLNVAVFGEESAKSVNTFTVSMGETGMLDEGPTARRMAAELGTTHHEVALTSDSLLEQLDEIVWAQDEPVNDPVNIPLYLVAALARSEGTVVLQAGEGADEMFAGYAKYQRYIRQRQLGWNPLQHVPQRAARLAFLLGRGLFQSHQAGKILDVVRRRGLGQEYIVSSAVGFFESEKGNVCSESFLRRNAHLDSFDIVRPFYGRLADMVPEPTFLQVLAYLELNLRLPELLLMRVDKMAMANSVEVRVPFLDHELIEFAFNSPDDFKLHDGVGKEPVKRLAARFVPFEDVIRPKRGFGAPMREWLNGPLRDRAIGVLRDNQATWEPVFDVPKVIERLDRGHTDVNEAFQTWVVVNLALWWESVKR